MIVKPYESQEVSFSGGCILTMGWQARYSDNTIKLNNVESLRKPKPEPEPELKKNKKPWWKFRD